MRPPSYYASLSNYNNYASSNLNLHNSNNYSPTSHHLNRSSSSHQLRTNFSSPSSSSYVTRSHLPFVSQSVLVAHCFTGVSSSTKPNYGAQQRHQPSYSSGSTTYSTSYSRPKSLKRYPLSSTTTGGSSYLTSTSSYTPSSTRSSYLGNSSTSSAYKRSPTTTTTTTTTTSSSRTTSYYPKPIRLRERPLLTQISRHLNTTGQSTASPSASYQAGSYQSATEPVHSYERRKTLANEPKAPVVGSAVKGDPEQEEQSWSSDVARNISRNKYLIKFREFEKRPSQAEPIQLTNSIKPENPASLQPVTNSSPIQLAENLAATPEASSTAHQQESTPHQSDLEARKYREVREKTPMKVPVDRVRRPSADSSDLANGLPKKVAAKTKQSHELVPATNEVGDDDKTQSHIVEVEDERPNGSKDKGNIKFKIRTGSVAPTASIRASEPEVQPQVTEVSVDGNPPRQEEKICMPEAQSSAISSDSPQVATKKPKVKRLIKNSSKAAIKTKLVSFPSEVKAAATGKENHVPEPESNKLIEQQATPKSVMANREILAPQQQERTIEKLPVMVVEDRKEEKKEISRDADSNRTKKDNNESDTELAQQNKRIRFRDYHLDDFNFLSVLGHGGWGFVILAELKEHDACFAVKCIKKITIVEDDDFDSIMIERKVLTLGNVHPFICKLFCTFETEGYLFFVMEYCAGGDLMFHVQKEGKFTESRCRFYAAEIICAIRFLHNRHIIYRDLKLDNILLDSRGHVRLVDFGMCQCRTYREEMLPSNFCGTPEYISPEIIKGVPYNHSVDWWSFGVLLYEMAIGKMPFRGNDENELLWNVCYEQIHYPMFLTKELTSLLQSLLEREPTKRMGMATCKAGDIYDQAWFRGVDWAAIEEMRVSPPFVPEVNSKRDVQNFDADFTESKAELSPIDDSTLQKIDQSQFQRFPYTNPDIFIFDSLCC